MGSRRKKPAAKKKAKPPTKPPKKGKGPPAPPADPADVPLDENEQRFLDEYLIDRNSSRAYRTTFPNTSHATARRHGYEMKNRPHVLREIQAAIHAQSIRTQVTADRALKEIARVAFSDIVDLYDPVTHQLRHPRHIPYETRKAISSVKVSRERRTVHRGPGQSSTTVVDCIVQYTLWPKMEALSKLCRHLGLDTEITPLDALLQALPRELATAVRDALAAPREVARPSTNGTAAHH